MTTPVALKTVSTLLYGWDREPDIQRMELARTSDTASQQVSLYQHYLQGTTPPPVTGAVNLALIATAPRSWPSWQRPTVSGWVRLLFRQSNHQPPPAIVMGDVCSASLTLKGSLKTRSAVPDWALQRIKEALNVKPD